MMAMAGNLPHYEDAARALYAGHKKHFDECTQIWPADVHAHSRWLAKTRLPSSDRRSKRDDESPMRCLAHSYL